MHINFVNTIDVKNLCYYFSIFSSYKDEYINKNYDIDNKGIYFITLSDTASTTTSGFSIITVYVSFILVIGQLIRTFTYGEAERVIFYEMPDASALINLCEGIKISRYKKEFKR